MGSSLLLLLAALTTSLLPRPAGAYNVDLRTAVVHGARGGARGGVRRGSMFGYSVAQHSDSNRPWLLVGAPRAQTAQPSIERGGAIYRCPIDSGPACELIQFDTKGNNIKFLANGQYPPIEEKSNQWFGATVASSGPDGAILGCAPRYVYFSERLDKREPVGACYVLPHDRQRDGTFYSPCQEGGSSYHRQGFCQAGISATLTDDGRKMVVGAVGSYYWQGQVFSQNLQNEVDLNQTRQGPYSNDYNYMGYAVAVADFSGAGKQDYVVGLPRANNLVGMMAVYRPNMTQALNVSGAQFGEYFGSALAVGDFNGDSLDDVAVGAPLYTDNSAEYETGRVLVYYQTSRHTFYPEWTTLRGSKVTASRFGFALASLGDINRDGYDDLVVGCPYDGDDKHGAIYIFNGHSRGMRTEPSQVLSAASVSPSLRTFGFSLSGGQDLDNNGYPDVLIGAYKSDSAVFLRSRPIVKVSVEMTISPDVIDLEDRSCQQSDGTRIVCFSVRTCITYTGYRVPSSIALNVTWQLEADRPFSSRAFYLNLPKQTTDGATFTLRERAPSCSNARVYLKTNFRDKLRPITIDASYSLMETRVGGSDVTPILDLYTPKTVRANGEIKKDCGTDNKCIPNLVVYAEAGTNSHILGTTDVPLDVMVAVDNRGEGAYEAYVTMSLPPGTSYVNVHDVISPLPVKCTPGVDEEGDQVPDLIICDLGNPLPARAKVSFTLRVSADNITGESDTIRFMMNVNSTNPELPTTVGDNWAEAVVAVRAVAAIRLTGVSYPERLFLNATWPSEVETEEDAGKELVHLYELRNLGPSPIETTSMFIYWPSYLDTDQDLLYLPSTPEVIQGEGRCTVLTHPVNPRNITVKSSTSDVDGDSPEVSVTLHHMLERRQRRGVESGLDQDYRRGEGRGEGRSPLSSERSASMDNELIRRVMCTSRSRSLCATIQCDTGHLAADDSILVRVRSRVWVRSLLHIPQRALIVTSSADAQVMSVPYDVTAEEYAMDTFQIDTYMAVLQHGPEYGQLEIWVIALSISGGFVLLLLLILLLWRCGFFKREKPEDMQKLNPNTNGHNTAAMYDAIPAEEL